jgi:toxin ParE1/3/4
VKPPEVAYAEGAIGDLESIFKWICEASLDPFIAERFVQRVRKKCDSIAYLPYSGSPRDDLLPGLRTVVFERKAVIAYVVRDGRVEITNVFYGGRDFEAIYRDAGILDVSE